MKKNLKILKHLIKLCWSIDMCTFPLASSQFLPSRHGRHDGEVCDLRNWELCKGILLGLCRLRYPITLSVLELFALGCRWTSLWCPGSSSSYSPSFGAASWPDIDSRIPIVSWWRICLPGLPSVARLGLGKHWDWATFFSWMEVGGGS